MSHLPFTTAASVPVDFDARFFDGIADDVRGFAEVSRRGRDLRIRNGTLEVDLRQSEAALRIRLKAADVATLAWLKMEIDNRVAAAEGNGRAVAWIDGSGFRVPERTYRRMTVAAVAGLTRRIRRLTLLGCDLAPFADGGLHVGLHLPAPGAPLPEPIVHPGGRVEWPAGGDEPALRAYTIRRIDVDRGTVDIDVVLHGEHGDHDAPGAGFAARARPGDPVGMAGPAGGGLPVARRYLLAGDETALPMFARQLERFAPDVTVDVLGHVADRTEQQPLASPATVTVRWLPRAGAETMMTELRELAPAVAADGGFILYAGEAGLARRIRTMLRDDLALDPGSWQAIGFWRRQSVEDGPSP